jgi:hypothetical protein
VASIQKRPSGQWRARYRDTAGKEHARHFARRVDAQRWLDEAIASTVRGDYVDPWAGREAVGEHAERWRATLVHRPNYLRGSTARSATTLCRRSVTVRCRRCAALTCRGSWRRLSARLGPNTVHTVYRTLSLLLAAAVDDRKIAVSPCMRIKLPSRPTGRRRRGSWPTSSPQYPTATRRWWSCSQGRDFG